MRIRSVADVMAEPAWVGVNDTIKDAFHTMYQRKLPGIPVVDEHYKVVGYVNMLDLMALQIHEMRENRQESADA
jgi:predicted transcriptional regulator